MDLLFCRGGKDKEDGIGKGGSKLAMWNTATPQPPQTLAVELGFLGLLKKQNQSTEGDLFVQIR